MEFPTVRLLRKLALTAAMSFLSGCASMALPNYTTEAETLAARGEPGSRRDNGDGTVTLEYSTQPEGTSCLMIQVDATGKVLRVWDALDDEHLEQVKPGMDKTAVDSLLGARRSEKVFPGTGDEVWDWKIARDGTLFKVHFANGRVKHVARDYPRGSRDDGWGWDDYWGPGIYYPAAAIFYFWSLDWRFRGRHWGGHWRHGGGGKRR
ncbi:MAG: hypothetical protein LBB76_10665 [Azoarcus sp.]|jgi:hypothetical protein|nr:hypothetical protein [Azoarcus sp.]